MGILFQWHGVSSIEADLPHLIRLNKMSTVFFEQLDFKILSWTVGAVGQDLVRELLRKAR